MDLKIVGWTYFECEYPTRKVNGEELNEIIYLIQEEIYNNNYIFGGEDHQNSFTGVPVFSDGTCFRASMRCWGSIMAPLFAGPNGESYTYMDFYMSLGDDAVMPDDVDIEVKPATGIEESVGCTLKQDREMIEQSLDMGMEFMTTDKVLKNLFEQKKKERAK